MLEMHSLSMLICTLGTMIISMLDNQLQIEILHIGILHTGFLHIGILHIGFLHLGILHIIIAIVCHILYLKKVIESIPHSNTKDMFHILGRHFILG